jgi:hypothetical protein
MILIESERISSVKQKIIMQLYNQAHMGIFFYLPGLEFVPNGDCKLFCLLGSVHQVTQAPVLVAVVDLRKQKVN